MSGQIINQTRGEYDEMKARVNFSTLKHMARSPAHYRHARDVGGSDRDVLMRGRATHLAVFEPEKFQSDCVVYKGKTRRGKEWDEFSWEHCDKDVLTESMHASASGVAAAVRSCEMAQKYLVGGRYEVSCLWEHVTPAIHGVPGFQFGCRARLDVLLPNAIVDLKTCKDAQDEAFGRQMINLFGHVQAAWYSDAVLAITGKRLPYVWIASEAAAPYVTQVYVADDDTLELGRQHYRAWLDRLHVCTEEGRWPGYAESPMGLVVPRWAIPHSDEEVIEEEAA